jgi:hypothetical protein
LQRTDCIPAIDRPAERRDYLLSLAADANLAAPGLRWIAEGRNPWEVFRDTKFLGNSRVAKCSLILKQQLARTWLEANCDPAATTIYLGIGWQERTRFEGGSGKVGMRQKWLPWAAAAPMCDAPYCPAYEYAHRLDRRGINPPRLYDHGFQHNNCGGFCVKSGQQNFALLLREFPERYSYHAAKEEELRKQLGDVAILRDRRGGKDSAASVDRLRGEASRRSEMRQNGLGRMQLHGRRGVMQNAICYNWNPDKVTYIDIETQSAVNLRSVGGRRYLRDPSTRLLSAVAMIDDHIYAWIPAGRAPRRPGLE